jgi:foldase protein PrsA
MPKSKNPVKSVDIQDKVKVSDALKKIGFTKVTKIILIVVLIGGILYLSRSLFVAALVNGKPITRYSLVRDLEAQGGKATLNNLIEKSLIFQEAAKASVKVDTATVDGEIKKIEDNLKTQNLTLDEALTARGLTRDSLSEQIKIQKTVEGLLSSKISTTDDEIKTYFDQNKTLFDKAAKLDDVKEQIKEQLITQKLSAEYQKWIADLKAKAKINYFVNF